jgi:hypothetical protein
MDRADSPIFWKGSPVPANARPAEDPRAPSGTRGSAEARTSCSEVYLNAQVNVQSMKVHSLYRT